MVDVLTGGGSDQDSAGSLRMPVKKLLPVNRIAPTLGSTSKSLVVSTDHSILTLHHASTDNENESAENNEDLGTGSARCRADESRCKGRWRCGL